MGVNLKFGQIYTYKIAWLMILAIFQEYKFEFWSNLQYANFDFGKFSRRENLNFGQIQTFWIENWLRIL